MLSFKNAARNMTKLQLISVRYSSFSGNRGPAPPMLDPEEQKEFERLQQAANTQSAIDEYNKELGFKNNASPKVTSDIGQFTAAMQTIPEFEGDTNPVTGEVNGPKQDPIKHGDWSFNGRVTDF